MKKVKIFIILIVLILIVLLAYLIYFNASKKEETIKYKKMITINIGEDIPSVNEYTDLKDNVSEISFKDIIIEDNKVYYAGIYQGSFSYKNNKYIVKLKVIDNIEPTIDGVNDITVYVGEKPDFYKDIVIKDNSKDVINKQIDGKYDINKTGTYKLKYTVTDKSLNQIEKEFKLIVKEKEVSINKNSTNDSKNLGTTSKGYKIERKNGVYYINGILIANKTYSLPSTYNPGGILNIFTSNYNKMNSDAKKEGINLRIISGFRSYQTQSTLYNNYVARDGKTLADRYSARAGHSEHQSGLAADINSLEQSWENTKEGKWLNDNCYKYGFIIRYPKGKESITGYMFEPWHIRYVGTQVATTLYNNGNWISLEEYLGIDSKYQ